MFFLYMHFQSLRRPQHFSTHSTRCFPVVAYWAYDFAFNFVVTSKPIDLSNCDFEERSHLPALRTGAKLTLHNLCPCSWIFTFHFGTSSTHFKMRSACSWVLTVSISSSTHARSSMSGLDLASASMAIFQPSSVGGF